MVADIGDRDDLLARLTYALSTARKPVAFVVGSGLTRGSVRGVEQMVRAMRAALNDEEDAHRLDDRLQGLDPGQRYQAAAGFLARNRGQDLVNLVIRLSVMAAANSMSQQEMRAIAAEEARLQGVEATGTWALDPGVAALGDVLVGMHEDVRGPVITTNFDPLIEVAIRDARGTCATEVFDIDGALSGTDQAGLIRVAHVHGFWRLGDTLHTVSQLTNPRPQLSGSLREALRGHLVVILGYSGWADAFSNCLMERAEERQSLGMEVLWGAFGKVQQAEIESGLLGALYRQNFADIYEGIDANELLPALAARLRNRGAMQEPGTPRLTGWTNISPEYLTTRSGAVKSLDQHREAFFNGKEPDWAVASDAKVPSLTFSNQLTDAVAGAENSDETQVIVGIGLLGEGKSLALRQCVSAMSNPPRQCDVYWREAGARLSVAEILELPMVEGRQYILASDDADLLLSELVALSTSVKSHGRTDIRFVGVAQERDWKNAGGLGRLAGRARVIRAGGLSASDAEAVVNAWATVGPTGLGELAKVEPGDRARAVQSAATDPATGSPDSLMGAMLRLRFGSGLLERVGDLLGRLDNHGAVGDSSLTQCFLMVALMHTATANGHFEPEPISKRLLAEACGVDETAIEFLGLDPLGAEAAISRHADKVWVRHEAIADAALEASRQRDSREVHEAIDRLVRSAVQLIPEHGTPPPDLLAAAYVARRLNNPAEAVLAADTAALAAPLRLSFAASRVTAHRIYGTPDDALEIAEKAWTNREHALDQDGRAALLDAWATALGASGHHAGNLLIHAKKLNLFVEDWAHDDAVRSLLGLGVALTRLESDDRRGRYGQALAGVVTLLEGFSLDRQSVRYMRNHEAACDRLGIQHPIDDPIAALRNAVSQVIQEGVATPVAVREVAEELLEPAE